MRPYCARSLAGAATAPRDLKPRRDRAYQTSHRRFRIRKWSVYANRPSASLDLAGNLLVVPADRAFKNAQVETGRSRFNTGKYCQTIALRATRGLDNGN